VAARAFPVAVEILGTIEVNDSAVLDLTRGEPLIGKSFGSEQELVEQLAINLVGQDMRLSQMDGWADLPDSAVTVSVGAMEATEVDGLAPEQKSEAQR
jgi:hypothetical protein